MKELFMQQMQEQYGYDLEREYLRDDILAHEEAYFEEQALKQNKELTTKIEIDYGKNHQQEKRDHQDIT